MEGVGAAEEEEVRLSSGVEEGNGVAVAVEVRVLECVGVPL